MLSRYLTVIYYKIVQNIVVHFKEIKLAISYTQSSLYLLNKLKKQYDTNGLLVNTEKTQAIFLGTSAMTKKIPKDFSLNFNGSNI